MNTSTTIERMNTEDVKALVTKLASQMESLMQDINSINTLVNTELTAVWSGDASNTFVGNWGKDYADYTKKQEEMQNLMQTITTVANNVESKEQELHGKMNYRS